MAIGPQKRIWDKLNLGVNKQNHRFIELGIESIKNVKLYL